MSRKDSVIREGDIVLVKKPLEVLRVGYPLTPSNCVDQMMIDWGPELRALADKAYGAQPTGPFKIMLSDPDRAIRGIAKKLGYLYCRSKNMGGSEREVYTREVAGLKGKIFEVTGKRVAKTGTHYPPSFGYCPEDYEPGGLVDCKTHIILSLKNHQNIWEEPLEIKATHVRKLSEADYRIDNGCYILKERH